MVKRISEGKATYEEVEALSYRVGKDLGKVLQERLSIIVPEDGMVPDNIYEAILGPVLNEGHNMVIEAAKKVQENMNKAAGIGLKAQTADFDEDRARRLAEKLKSGVFKETKWVLDEPVANFHQSSADRTLRKNVKIQARAGLHPKITRKAEGGCCKWCTGLAGTYDYGNEPKDIYRRHERCRCVVDFRPGDGKRQNVWSKEWHEDAEPEEVENRIKREKELEEERKKAEKQREVKRQSGGKSTGGHHYSNDGAETKNEREAIRFYEKVAREDDSKKIAENTGFSVEDIRVIRRHIFFNKHELDDGYRRFYADYDMAVAWKRLQEGSFLPRDITLLNHELLESKIEKEYNITVREAHEITQKTFNWLEQLMKETGGKGEADGLL